jgi:predicted N-acetyltransferase YhbS
MAEGDVIVGALQERDLPAAATIVRHAFGTFVGAPDLETFWADRDLVHSRWQAPHVASFGAILDGTLVGSNFATRWGSVGYFGPLTIRPGLWDRGIGARLMAPVMAQFEAWRVAHAGLFTFAHSTKHVGLYERFGFAARYLTAIMAVAPVRRDTGGQRYSSLTPEQQQEALRGCRAVADSLFAGLDLTEEIELVHKLGLGDTVLVTDETGVNGFAICHYGPTSEAGAGTCLVKFGAVRTGTAAERSFDRLLDACETLAVQAGLPSVMAGANMGRPEAYGHLKRRGYRAAFQGVTMHKPNEAGYSRPGAYVIDDWR